MKKSIARILQAALLLLGGCILFLLIRLPLTEGRAKELDWVSIYTDPLILYGYAAALVFFYGLFRVIRLLHLAGNNEMQSATALHTAKQLQYAALVFGMMIVLAAVYVRFSHHPDDDPAGFLALCAMLVLGSAIVAVFAFRFRMKSALTPK